MTPATLWEAHKAACARCRKVELTRPATLAGACLDGSRLAKDAAAEAARQVRELVAESPSGRRP